MFSIRLKTITKYLKDKSSLADVGTDHGYAIIDGFLNYDLKYAYAIDNKKGPLENAKKNISNYTFKDNVSFLLSDGLEKLDKEVDVIVFAGMGGLLIIDLIKKDFHKLFDARLVIAPNRDSYAVRVFLTNLNYDIIAEEVVYEDGKYYEVIVFEKVHKKLNYTDLELKYGPRLLKGKSETFKNKLLFELKKYKKIQHQNAEINKNIKEIEGILW